MQKLNDYVELYKGKRVLIIGIGGGGDIAGTLPVARFMKQNGAEPIIAGLTWKRKDHDPDPGPRKISEFRDIKPIGEVAGIVNSKTQTDKVKHLETELAGLFDYTVVTIDISGGFEKTYIGLRELTAKLGISFIVGLDVGGDVLCKGDEKETIRSPMPDQVLLAAISKFQNALLAVLGVGSDGELPITNFYSRFENIQKRGGYLGAISLTDDDLDKIGRTLDYTECSRIAYETAKNMTSKQLEQLERDLNSSINIRDYKQQESQQIRSGTRTAELSLLTAVILFFKPEIVYNTNMFSEFIEEPESLFALRKMMNERGYTTGLDEGN